MISRMPGVSVLMGLLLFLTSQAPQAEPVPDLVISGKLTGVDHETYQTQPFLVPEGIDQLTVVFDYDNGDHTTVDLGLADPQRFRGWSGGNKSTFTLTETYATPSYLPGPLPAGTWRLVLGVPNIRAGSSTDYRTEIYFRRGVEAFTRPFASAPVNKRAGWYRGDLHLHSGHSDGACQAQSGSRVPCPLSRTVAAAAGRGLDFIAVTEHNTRSHHQGLMELQAVYDRMVIIPGRELTTFRGHANVFGSTGFIDFRQPVNDLVEDASAAGGLVSINHPGLPSDERCLGCGWRADVSYDLVSAVEVVSGGAYAASGNRVHGPLSGIPFWDALLNEGFRVTAIAGSDNHDPDTGLEASSSVGYPTTVIHAESLSQPDLLEGVRRGRVFIDVEGTSHRLLEFSAVSGDLLAQAGAVLPLDPTGSVEIEVGVTGVTQPQVILIRDGKRVQTTPPLDSGSDASVATFELTGITRRSWIRVEVTDAVGRVLLLSNPLYLALPTED